MEIVYSIFNIKNNKNYFFFDFLVETDILTFKISIKYHESYFFYILEKIIELRYH